jgi:hypothetical protein
MGYCCVCGKDAEYLYRGELCCYDEDCIEVLKENGELDGEE